MQVNILDAQNRLSQRVKLTQNGEDVVIANRGQPVARLVAVSPMPLAGLAGVAAGDVSAWLDLRPLPLHAPRSASEIDAALIRERMGW